MAKKRKSDNVGLDEVDRTLYTSFCTAANSISQLYTQAQHQQKLAFEAGERHCTEKLYQWLQREYQAGSNLSMQEIFNYLQQSQLDGDDMTMSPGSQFQQQHPLLQQQQLLSTSNQAPAGPIVYSGLANVGRVGVPVDQAKISVFTNALASPNRTSLPLFGIMQEGYGSVNVSNGRNEGQRLVGGPDQDLEVVCEEQVSSTSDQAYNRSSYLSDTDTVTPVYGYNPLPGQHQNSYPINDSSMDIHPDDGGSNEYYQ